ncbi:hypothetical protein ACHAWF_003503 [Thalassiosira exigua]
MTKLSAACFVRACLALSLLSRSSAAVVDLTDATFEHQTQASTGQTTGKWLVKVSASRAGTDYESPLGPHALTQSLFVSFSSTPRGAAIASRWRPSGEWKASGVRSTPASASSFSTSLVGNLTETDDRPREELDGRLGGGDGSDDGSIVVAKVDATEEKRVADRFQIQSYPTIKYFADRQMFDYKGGRSVDALYDFVTEGYQSALPTTIPPPPSAFEAKMTELRTKFEAATRDRPHLKYLLEDFDHIVSFRKNAAAVLLGLGSILGFMFGILVSLLLGLGGSKGPSGKKKAKKE